MVLTLTPPPPPSTHGGVPKFSFEEAKKCKCEDAFKYACRESTYASYMGPGDLVCPTWTRGPLVGSGMRLHTADYFKEHDSEVHGFMVVGGQMFSGSVVVLGVGLHENLDANIVIRDVVGPTIEHAEKRGDTRVICMMLPAPDMDLKPEQWKTDQGSKPVADFNEKIRRYCTDRGVEVFEMWAPTTNGSSYDGTHFGLSVNALLGQLFLNTLAHGKGWEKASKEFPGYLL